MAFFTFLLDLKAAYFVEEKKTEKETKTFPINRPAVHPSLLLTANSVGKESIFSKC